MPDDPRRDLDDLDHVLFDGAPGGPGTSPLSPARAEPADLDSVLFSSAETLPTQSYGAGVGYAEPPLSRTRRVLVALGVVTLVALAVMATVAFASDSGGPPTDRVQVPGGSGVTSTTAVLRRPASLPVGQTVASETTEPDGTTATTRRRTPTPVTAGATEDPAAVLPTQAPAPFSLPPPPAAPPPAATTSPRTTTTTTLPPDTTTTAPPETTTTTTAP